MVAVFFNIWNTGITQIFTLITLLKLNKNFYFFHILIEKMERSSDEPLGNIFALVDFDFYWSMEPCI